MAQLQLQVAPSVRSSGLYTYFLSSGLSSRVQSKQLPPILVLLSASGGKIASVVPVHHGSFFLFHTEQWEHLCCGEAHGEESHSVQTSHASTLAGCCKDHPSPSGYRNGEGSLLPGWRWQLQLLWVLEGLWGPFYLCFHLLVLWSMEARIAFPGVFLSHGHVLQSKSLAANISRPQQLSNSTNRASGSISTMSPVCHVPACQALPSSYSKCAAEGR